MLLYICLIYNANIHFISVRTKLIWKYYNFIILFNLNKGRILDVLVDKGLICLFSGVLIGDLIVSCETSRKRKARKMIVLYLASFFVFKLPFGVCGRLLVLLMCF